MANLMENHGSARRVPPPGDEGWSAFTVWVGSAGSPAPRPEAGELEISAATGRLVARSGDWLVKTMAGALHVARPNDNK